ncbi:MAG: DUF167 domain-containing protein [Deltaproteobacteria bacterium]|nr:DUF167 domain-containing protein [Deltaproteobacteria bacterium]MBW2256769.1 DUF167 domain-containing protein [Deltaproteobacteria bacterium]
MLLPVWVQPRSRCAEVVGVVPETGALKVRVKAPPVGGAANKELLRFLGRKVLRVPPSDLEIVHGRAGRNKLIAVAGLTLDEARARLR